MAIAAFALLVGVGLEAAEPISSSTRDFLATYCLDCHRGEMPEGDVNLDVGQIAWTHDDATTMWERVYDVLTKQTMPPADTDQPSGKERAETVQWLKSQLTKHVKPGGTVLRRLNREEYENSIRDLFDLPDFVVPSEFPSDDSEHGFDNIGEALILSPPLLGQYLLLATRIADDILPPASGPIVPNFRRYDIGAAGLAESKGTSIEGDRFRITCSKSNANAAGWPARFEAAQSGVYRLTVDASAFQTDSMFYPRQDEPFLLSVYARMKTEQTYDALEKVRKVAEFDVLPNHNKAQTFTCEIELTKGEAFGLRWQNGPDDTKRFAAERLKQDPKMHAAMLQLGKDPRGMNQVQYYELTTAMIKENRIDLNDPRLGGELESRGFGGIGQRNGPRLMVSWYVHEELRRFGPALDVLDVSIEGPLRLIEDDETRARNARTAKFLGKRAGDATDVEFLDSVLRRFLSKAFRRPASDDLVRSYRDLAMLEISSSPDARLEDGLHVAVRRALISPNFLYRNHEDGPLDDFALASRLSYFLTSAPPDQGLSDLAAQGKLSNPEVLRRETLRLLRSERNQNFVSSFTGQWLGTRSLHDIMPDPRLFFYYAAHRNGMTNEAEMFFSEILQENHRIDTFIDPDFSYRNKFLNGFYGDNLESPEMQRVSLEKGARHGGILGLAAVMMATANGVDTHPVHRGVWLLENVFGTPTPDPPDNVPAISPDTSGTTTMRTQLAAHRADEACARCHDQIDPLGMVMENFDPVGRWRDHYPIYTQPADGEEALKEQFYSNTGKGTKAGPSVDSVGVLVDGTRLEDVVALKRYLVEHIDIFSRCLATKLLVYATGRPMNFGDRHVIDQIVKDVRDQGNGFRDLVVAVVLSDSFRVK